MTTHVKKRILFVVAHPDDAELAAGGFIRKSAAQGHDIKTINLTISENTEETRNFRLKAAENAASILGFQLSWYADRKYNQVEEIPISDLVGFIDKEIESFQPDIIFTHWDGDSHWDHILTSKAVMASTRKWSGDLYFIPPNELKTVRQYGFNPNTFVDISDFFELKLDAIHQYNSFQGNIFRSLNVENVNRVNSYFGIIMGCDKGEAFLLQQKIEIL
ncbi:MAG: PIG-L family deacetylase [Ignavibacteriae bacterium]|nr:PIG-L family deacetylase [Ignavibacteriota bacterium]